MNLIWFAIATYLGVVKLQNRKSAWRKDSLFQQPWIVARMSLWRFETIMYALNSTDHWNLPSTSHVEDMNKRHPFWQIDELVALFNARAKKYFHMGRLMSADEAVVPFKGRHRARCYNPKKPAKYHLKKFGLNCAKTGYLYSFYYYEGKAEARPANIPATTYPICRLLDSCPELLKCNRVLAMDNWFSSCATLNECRDRGVHVVGTMRADRLGLVSKKGGAFPLAGAFKEPKVKVNRAEFICHKTQVAPQQYDHYVTAWMDAKPVLVLSSYPPHDGQCIRKIREGAVWTAQTFHRPTVISDYNSAMGGTDLHDMRLAFIRSTVKSRRWQVSCRHRANCWSPHGRFECSRTCSPLV